MTRAFWKMHGLGNDFVIFDGRGDGFRPDETLARAVANRRYGLGCDQVIALGAASQADAFMEIWNADGSKAGACGNAARCVAKILLEETGKASALIETEAGILTASREGAGFRIDMGAPRLGWDEIPLAQAMDTLSLDFQEGPLKAPCAVSMGNPHCVFFVEDAEAIDLAALGPRIERAPLFPERANVCVAQLCADNVVRLRVWERGAGITTACGTGACATAVAAIRRGLATRERPVTVHLDGGQLSILWDERGHAIMTGPAVLVAAGHVDLEALGVRP